MSGSLAIFLLVLLLMGCILIYATMMVNEFESRVKEFNELLSNRYKSTELSENDEESP